MTSIVSNIKIYLTNNGKTYDNEKVNFQVNGDDNSIEIWNVSGLVKPTDEQLSDLEDEAVALEAEEEIVINRRKEYPTWREQLDMIYHDLDDWRTSIKTVKDKYPKS